MTFASANSLSAPGRDQAVTAALQRFFLGAGFALIFILSSVDLVHGSGNGGINQEVLFKLGLWSGAGFLGLISLRQLLPLLGYPGTFLFVSTLALGALSATYSVDPVRTLGSCYGLGAVTLYTALTMRNLSERQVLGILVGSIMAFVVVSWWLHFIVFGGVFANVSGEVLNRLGGLNHPNAIGRFSAIGLGVCILLFMRRRLGAVALVLVAAVSISSLIATQSRTAAFAVALGVVLVTLRRLSVPALVVVTSFGGILTIALVTVIVADPTVLFRIIGTLARGGEVSEVYNLAGRTYVWLFSWEEIKQAPMLGHGFGASRELFLARYTGHVQFMPGSTHNGFLEVLISLGWLGGALVIATIGRQLYLFATSPNDVADFLLFFVLLNGLTTAGPYSGTPSGDFIIFIASLLWRPCLAEAGRRALVGAAEPRHNATSVNVSRRSPARQEPR